MAIHRLTDPASGALLARRLRPAWTHWTRLRGLLGTRRLPAGDGLWLRPCNQVHMFGMRYALDVLLLDDDLRVVGLVHRLRPWAVSPKVREATSAVELPAGTLEALGVALGARLAVDPAPAAAPKARSARLGTAITNGAVASLFLLFAAVHVRHARVTGQWLTTLPIVAQELLLVLLFLTRRPSTATSDRAFDWAVGIVGTFSPFLLRPALQPGALAWLGGPLQALGVALSVVALVFLGRSIGVVAANRGVKTAGLYRVVRHPMYAAHLTGCLGYILAHPTAWNGVVVLVLAVALNARAVVEERLLARDPVYRSYLESTRWRLLPLVY